MLKNKDFKTIYYSEGNQCYPSKVVPQVNLVIPPVVNRLISVGELRAVAIKHLVELSVEHEFFGHLFSKRKTCHEIIQRDKRPQLNENSKRDERPQRNNSPKGRISGKEIPMRVTYRRPGLSSEGPHINADISLNANGSSLTQQPQHPKTLLIGDSILHPINTKGLIRSLHKHSQ